MQTKSMWRIFAFIAILAMIVSACGQGANPPAQPPAQPAETQPPAATQPPAEEAGGFQIPDIEQGKFNVAMVLIGPHDDGGWSQAHFEGLDYVEKNVPNVHTAYIENVPEGAELGTGIPQPGTQRLQSDFRHILRLHGSDGDCCK